MNSLQDRKNNAMCLIVFKLFGGANNCDDLLCLFLLKVPSRQTGQHVLFCVTTQHSIDKLSGNYDCHYFDCDIFRYAKLKDELVLIFNDEISLICFSV